MKHNAAIHVFNFLRNFSDYFRGMAACFGVRTELTCFPGTLGLRDAEKNDRKNAAAFLREWADGIEGKGEENDRQD